MTAASAVGGLVVGVAWRVLAPVATLQTQGGGVVSVGPAESSIAADGWFAVCAVVAGAVAAAVAVTTLRAGRLGVLVGLVAGGLVGSLVAWRLGVLLGPPPVAESAVDVATGERFDGPLVLSAKGVLLAWSTGAVIVFFALVAGIEARPEPEPQSPSPDGADLSLDDRQGRPEPR